MIKSSAIVKIFTVSLALSVVGFMLDWNERVPNFITNLKDVSLMTVVFFVFLCMTYMLFQLIRRRLV